MLKFFNINDVAINSEKFWLFLAPEHARLSFSYLQSQIAQDRVHQIIWFSAHTGAQSPTISLDFTSGQISAFQYAENMLPDRGREKRETLDGYRASGLFYFPTYTHFLKYKKQLQAGEFLLDMQNETILGLPFGRPSMDIPWGDFAPALLLDRDGVINVDREYVYEFKNIDFLENIFNLVRSAHKLGYKTYVLTNQSGVGRGYYSEQQVVETHRQMNARFLLERAPITAWAYSPFHRLGQGQFKGDSLTRKPFPGMLHQLQEKYPIDLNNSIMLGDKVSDALYLKGPQYIHLQGQYDLSAAKNKVYQNLGQVIKELFSEK